MLEHYRTLGAILALGEFNVAELAALSGVGEPTIRTTLRREAHYVEQLGTEPTGRRGGQPVRWRLRPEARERLRDRLREFEQLGAGPWLDEPPVPEDMLPAGLIAAEDVLLRLVPAADNPKRRAELVQLARAQLDAADATAPADPGAPINETRPSVSSHRRIVGLLLDLEEIQEQARHHERSGLTARARRIVMDLLLAAGKADEEPLTETIRKRAEHSLLFLAVDDVPADSGGVGLATALNGLGLDLQELGRHQEAVAIGLEAISLWRSLAAHDRACQPGLAFALSRISLSLQALGRPDQAAAMGQEAAGLWRSLAADTPITQAGLTRAESSEAPTPSSGPTGSGSQEPSPAVPHEIPCATVLDLVYSYLDGELDAAENAKVRQHLDECRQCSREYALEEEVKRLVQKHAGHESVPPDIRHKVLIRIREIRIGDRSGTEDALARAGLTPARQSRPSASAQQARSGRAEPASPQQTRSKRGVPKFASVGSAAVTSPRINAQRVELKVGLAANEDVSVRQVRLGPEASKVVVIERSRGVQVGQSNRQLNQFRYELVRSRVSVDDLLRGDPSRQRALAGLVSNPRSMVANWVFRQSLSGSARSRGHVRFIDTSNPHIARVAAGLDEWGRVVVARSRGAQVGDGDAQRNRFSYQIAGQQISLDTMLRRRPQLARSLALTVRYPGNAAAQRSFAGRLASAYQQPERSVPDYSDELRGAAGLTVSHGAGVQLGAGNSRVDRITINVPGITINIHRTVPTGWISAPRPTMTTPPGQIEESSGRIGISDTLPPGSNV